MLYPGPDSAETAHPDPHLWAEFHELIPGLGAFVVRPGKPPLGLAALDRFIGDVVTQVTSRYS